MFHDGDDKVDDDPVIDIVDITSEVKVKNKNSSPKHLSPNDSDKTEFHTDMGDND